MLTLVPLAVTRDARSPQFWPTARPASRFSSAARHCRSDKAPPAARQARSQHTVDAAMLAGGSTGAETGIIVGPCSGCGSAQQQWRRHTATQSSEQVIHSWACAMLSARTSRYPANKCFRGAHSITNELRTKLNRRCVVRKHLQQAIHSCGTTFGVWLQRGLQSHFTAAILTH